MRPPGWLAAMFVRPRDRSGDSVAFDGGGVTYRFGDGTSEAVAWGDVRLVEIRTTDDGPFSEDVFLVIHAGERSLVVPQRAEGFGALLDHLQAWPGFDGGAAIAAMTCTANAAFVCWRPGGPGGGG